MGDLALIVAAGLITFGSRVAFLVRPLPEPSGRAGRFLDVFPLALFIALATAGLAAPDGRPAVTPALAAAAGGVVGGVLFRRNLWGVIGVGAAAFVVVRTVG